MLRVLVFLAVATVALAAVARRDLSPKPDKYKCVPGCYVEEIDEVVPVGESRPSKTKCEEYTCHSDYVQISTCGAVFAGPPCYKVPGEGPYPNCCDQIVCP